MEQLTLNGLMTSKTYVREDGGMIFMPPSEYIRPFGDKFANISNLGEPVVQGSHAVINENSDETRNTAYGRFKIEIPINHEMREGFQSVIGLLVALDKSPEIKVYTGANASACLNLTIFRASQVFTSSLVGGYKDVYSVVEKWINEKEEEIKYFNEVMDRLDKLISNENDVDRIMGKLLKKAGMKGSKIGTTPIVQASARLHNPESPYYVGEGNNFKCDVFNIYNSITQSLTNSDDFFNRPDKTVALSKLFLN